MTTPIDSIFTPAQSRRVFETVIDQVQEAVCNGKLLPGDRLPPERQLQEILGISRNTLREALRVLEQKGLVEIRKGHKGGIFIQQVTTDPMSDYLDTFVRSNGVSLAHVAQFRGDLEGLLARRAAETASQTVINRLKATIAELTALRAEGIVAWDRFMEKDQRVHLQLAEVSANPIHSLFLEIIHNHFHRRNIAAFLPKDESYLDECLHDLTAVVDAVCRGDGASAQEAARQHVFGALARMQRHTPASELSAINQTG